VFCLLTAFISKGQPLFINDNAVITMKGGAYLIANPTLANAYRAIRLTGTQTGYIVCEEEINKVVWWLRNGANTNNIEVPFANASGVVVKIKMINIAAGSADGAMVFSTAPTTPDNKLISTGAYPSNVTNMFTNGSTADNSINTADRFWFVEYYNYANKPLCQDGFTFYYANADIVGLTENDLLAQYWNSGWVMPLSGILWDLNNDCASITDPRISAPWVLVSKNNVLPVELISLNAACKDENVHISWSTASETNNDYFTIERSSDAADWQYLMSMPGHGNSNTILNYSATDNNPFKGISYYRLRQTDFDGKSEIFGPVSVNCEEETMPQMSCYPNPFNSVLVVDIKNVDTDKAVIRIFDAIGKKVFEKDLDKYQIETQRITIDLQGFSKGIYSVQFNSDSFTSTSKIVKE